MRILLIALAFVSVLQTAPQLRFDIPNGWQSKPPASSMRVAEFILPRAGSDKADAALTVYFFGQGSGGGVQANLDRWIGQMTQPDGRASRDVAKTDARKSRAGLPLTIVDIAGTYVAEVTPGSPEKFNEPGYRLIAAVVETSGGTYYVKLTGPSATVARWHESVNAFLDSLRVT